MTNRIMYVCSECADNSPEGCGHYDRNTLRVVGDLWLCESCFDELTPADRGDDPDADGFKGWADFPPPRAYAPLEGT